ncbi:MAG TPA: hypothetical protein VIY86_05460, partial [Pirellulaceae bacterium]
MPAPSYTTVDPGYASGFDPAFPVPNAPPPEGYYGPLIPYNDGDALTQSGSFGLGGVPNPWTVPAGSPYPGAAVPAAAPNPLAANAPYLEGASTDTDGHVGRLQIYPRRLVAPVGKEIILQAGICGDDGYLITRQPIEWTVAPDSVGSIVEVDQVNKPLWRAVLRKAPRKINGQYALGLTSSRDQTLPRGTPDPNDDLYIAEGQTWVSLTSSSEGATQVTAVASTTAGWESRRDTATIHWVDGQWELPPPVVGGANGAVLTTRVTRSTNNLPVEGWRIRYEVSGGPPAAFDAAGAQSIEVVTNSDGLASATLAPLGGYAGTTNIRVQVIRVGTSSGDLPKLVVGEGNTTVTWLDAPAAVVPVVPGVP